MSNFINAVKALLAIIPYVLEMVKAIEVPGFGVDKLAAITKIVAAAFEALPDDIVKLIGAEKVEGFVVKVVGIMVDFLNKIGVFKKA